MEFTVTTYTTETSVEHDGTSLEILFDSVVGPTIGDPYGWVKVTIVKPMGLRMAAPIRIRTPASDDDLETVLENLESDISKKDAGILFGKFKNALTELNGKTLTVTPDILSNKE